MRFHRSYLAIKIASLPSLLHYSCLAFPSSVHTTFSDTYPSSPLSSLPRLSPRQTTTSRPSISPSSVSVYNNVFDDEACKRLHDLASEASHRSRDGSFLFRRGENRGYGTPRRKQKLTPIETAIDRILSHLNDTSPIVEYWSRDEYINVDAHADVDENTLRDDGVLRCPRNGHVLYMRIANADGGGGDGPASESDTDGGDDDRTRMGPTVVFSNRRVAWGSVTPRATPMLSAASYNSRANLEERSREYVVDVENYWDEETRRRHGCGVGDGDPSPAEGEEMTIVPAVNGRLLRFDGAAFHSVPKPPDRYLLGEEELAAFLKRESEEEDCDDDDDDDDDYWDDDEFDEYDDEEEETNGNDANQRWVLIFNTWPEGSFGPKGVLPDRAADAVPDGISIEGDGRDAPVGDSAEDERRRRWQDAHGENFEGIWCNPFEDWGLADVDRTRPSAVASRGITVPLMGNPSRRGCMPTEAVLEGPVANSLFRDGRKVSAVMLERSKE